MSWDNKHGILFKTGEAKLYSPEHTWATKLSQLSKQKGVVHILTYNFSSMGSAHQILSKRPYDIWLICHEKFRAEAMLLKRAYPDVRIACHPALHSKVVAIEPNTVYVGSENFGDSGWHETTLGVRSVEAHDWFVTTQFEPLWRRSRELLLFSQNKAA